MDRIRKLAFAGIGIWASGFCGLVRAADSAVPALPPKVQVSSTENLQFPSGGTLHLKDSIGELTIEGWDQPGLEISTTKSSKFWVEGPERDKAAKVLDSVKVITDRKGDEVTVTTEFPRHRKLARPFKGLTGFDLEYHIKVPRNAHLIIDHDIGEVHIENITGEIHATDHMGLIVVRVPEGQYAIDATSKVGAVSCDFPGNEKSIKWLGHSFVASPAAPQKMFLHVGYGDILILRIYDPPPPAAGVPAGK